MKNTVKIFLAAAAALILTTGCIKETQPQTNRVTSAQAAAAPGSFDLYVDALTSSLVGQFVYGGNSETLLYDFGYPTFFLEWDIMGQDLIYPYQNWYTYWYTIQYLGPSYRFSQLPWTYFYGWINNCNTVLSLAGETPDDDKKAGAGMALALRAFFYLDLAQMFANKPYTEDKNAETVPLVIETTAVSDMLKNPRATNEKIYAQIIADLDKAETYLEGYVRPDIYTPDVSVVYGLKARAYLLMGDWANAVTYAQKAQKGYTVMDEATYTDWDNGFNTPTSSWMFGAKYNADDPCIQLNDADSSWGSCMVLEIDPKTSGCGYAANYGQPFVIDRHLYETIPATDFRKKCFVDFAIDDMAQADALTALSAYTAHPDWIYNCGHNVEGYDMVGGLELKFRPFSGDAGRANQYIGFCLAVPFMRVEEMVLIEAEAAGRLNEADGIAKLTAFAKTRDASYTYGTHTDAYGNTSTSQFINEVWWQRRVEFWGEGLATKDIKRLQKGIIRSYKNTNHIEGYRYNTTTTPEWMNLCIVQTETNYNTACTNNPDPKNPGQDSDEFTF